MGWAWLLMVTALLAISSFPFTLCNVCSLVCPRLRKTWCSGEHQLQSAAAAPQNSLPQSLTLGLHQLLVGVFFLKVTGGPAPPTGWQPSFVQPTKLAGQPLLHQCQSPRLLAAEPGIKWACDQVWVGSNWPGLWCAVCRLVLQDRAVDGAASAPLPEARHHICPP